MTRVVVIGSANVDLVVEVERRPLGGETLIGSDARMAPGGKGANQAAAVSRAGAPAQLVACVGADANADLLRHHLNSAGVELDGISIGGRPTGTAMILLTPDAENSIVVSPGANHELDTETVVSLEELWLVADVIVLSLEIPMRTAQEIARRARAAGIRLLLNAAPAAPLSEEMLRACDPLIVNEHEARSILRDAPGDAGFDELAALLLRRGASSVVITLGASGSVVADASGIDAIPAHRVEVVDTTGAGDAFVGATACELAHGADLRGAVRFATAFAALSVSAKGALTSYPDRDAVERLRRIPLSSAV